MAITPSLRTWLLVLVILLLGSASAIAGPFTAVAALGAAILVASVRWPSMLLFGLILYEPLEALLVSGQPQILKSADELFVLAAFLLVAAMDLFQNGLSRLLKHFLFIPTLLFVFSNVVSTLVNGVEPGIALAGIYVTLDYVILALLLGCSAIDNRTLVRVYRLMFYVSLLVCFATLLQIIVGHPLIPGYNELIRTPLGFIPRYRGPFEHPNDLANFMVYPVVIAAGLVFYPVQGIRHARLWLVVFLAFFFLAIGRVAWVSLFLSFAVFVTIYHRRLWLPIWLRFAPVLLIFGPLLYFGFSQRLNNTIAKGDARITFARRALPLLEERPLLGVGPGRFGGVVANRFGSDLHYHIGIIELQRNSRIGTVDNFWLHLLVESGLLGTAFFCLMLLLVARRADQFLRRCAIGDPARPLAAACFLLTIYEVFYNVSAPALEDNMLIAYYWLLVGVLAGASKHEASPSEG